MAGAIAQDRESCQFPFVLDEKPIVVSIDSDEERLEGARKAHCGRLARIQSERRPQEPFARLPTAPYPSRPVKHWVFHQPEKELTPLPVLRYGSDHRKKWFKNPIHATIALTVEGALLARSYCPVVGIRTRSLIFGRQEGF